MLENLTNEEDQHKRNVTSLIGDYGNKLEPSTIKIIHNKQGGSKPFNGKFGYK